MTETTMTRRAFLQSLALTGGAALGGLAAPARGADLPGLRQRIEHVIVLFQENRSFDHYFGAYQHPRGATVTGLLDGEGNVHRRFHGLQKNPAGIPYSYLPMPENILGFDGRLFKNQPFHLGPYMPPWENLPWDPEHHFFRMFAQVDNGAMDQFVALALKRHHAPFSRAGERDLQLLDESRPSGAVLGHYTRQDIPHYHHLADEYVLFDHFFQAMSGGSTCNALYLVAAHSALWRGAPANLRGSFSPPLFDLPYDPHGVLINDLPPLNGPTEADPHALKFSPPPAEQTYPNIGDRLNAAGISWAWYNEGWNAVKPWALKSAFGRDSGSAVIDTNRLYVPHHNPFQFYPSWFDNVRAGHIRDSEDFLADARRGALPSVSFVKATGVHDEHPADSAPRWGEAWVMSLLRAVADGPAWNKTAVLITYDEGGGFWDHVAPPRPDAYGCGTRIPALLVSPWARRGYVDHRIADTTSVLAFIETRFGLKPLQTRDARAYNLLDGLDFTQRAREASFG
ncbi:MAG: phospholipase C [Steroidobacteraceae bacterium]